jgi:hypothetical protein
MTGSNDMDTYLTPKTAGAYLEKAAARFMMIKVKVSRSTLQKQSEKVRQAAEEQYDTAEGVTTGGFKLLGNNHDKVKHLIGLGAKVNTYLNGGGKDQAGKALPCPIDGYYLFHVDDIPQAWTDLQKMKADQEHFRDVEFLPFYDQFVQAAKEHLKGLWDESLYPSASEIKDKFKITIEPPRALPMSDMAAYANINLGEAAKWADEAAQRDAVVLEQAREFILDHARFFLEEMEKNITNNNFRVTKLKVEKLEHLSTQLRRLVDDWDGDTRLKLLSDLIDSKILPPIRKGETKGNASVQEGIRRAAKTVVKGIDDDRADKARLKAAKADKSATLNAGDEIVAGGLLADLM